MNDETGIESIKIVSSKKDLHLSSYSAHLTFKVNEALDYTEDDLKILEKINRGKNHSANLGKSLENLMKSPTNTNILRLLENISLHLQATEEVLSDYKKNYDVKWWFFPNKIKYIKAIREAMLEVIKKAQETPENPRNLHTNIPDIICKLQAVCMMKNDIARNLERNSPQQLRRTLRKHLADTQRMLYDSNDQLLIHMDNNINDEVEETTHEESKPTRLSTTQTSPRKSRSFCNII